ncbi:MAG: hypothetical protein AB7K35_09005 [Pseudorhodoplanes sp.]
MPSESASRTPPAGADLLQAIVLFDEANARDYGLALWALLHEVEHFYRPLDPKRKFARFYICPTAPERTLFGQILHGLGSVMYGSRVTSALDVLRPAEVIATREQEQAVGGPYGRVIEQARLTEVVRRMIGCSDLPVPLMIVTDRAITPPPEWRYVIWAATSSLDSVLSVAPLDPNFWRERDPHRIQTVKNRARSAALSITGVHLAIARCDNPECVMFGNVDSVTTLDEMTTFGPEHAIPALEGRGFSESAKDATAIEPVLRTARGKMRR